MTNRSSRLQSVSSPAVESFSLPSRALEGGETVGSRLLVAAAIRSPEWTCHRPETRPSGFLTISSMKDMQLDKGAYIILEAEEECVMFAETERQFVADARVGRLATVSADGEPHVVPICHAFADEHIVIALDEKPQTVAATDLKRVQNIRANSLVSLVFDQYTENWNELGWVRVTGHAELVEPNEDGHEAGIATLSEKYQQYADQTLSNKLMIRIDPHRVRSWGALDDPPSG